ncbi:hypothetical protein ANCCAN_07736 [Ancylostoma caninum]|uniref:Uncharacterized protein n=1 Tax=Ancylostoma caninum TaxID=29170 RepID=A0A368GTF9_ANCCA|nr:hypothetical protein ANCCAN_07736 [Ancylostoma caninum]
MQGRSSPRSPTSPQQSAARKANQQSSALRRPSMVHPQHEMLALQQQQALFAAAQGISPLSIFPQMVNNNNKLTTATLDTKLAQSEYKAGECLASDPQSVFLSSYGFENHFQGSVEQLGTQRVSLFDPSSDACWNWLRIDEDGREGRCI